MGVGVAVALLIQKNVIVIKRRGIVKVTATNFFSYTKLHIDLKKYDNKFVLIEGNITDKDKVDSNGSGKSTILEAIVFGLFGKTIRGVRYADDVINSKIKKNCCVSVEFGDYVINRYRKHSKHKNGLFLLRKNQKSPDGFDDLRCKNDSETQNKICEVIGLDYNTFIGSHIFAGSSTKFTSITDAERKEILRALSDAGWVSECLVRVQDRIKINEEKRYEADINLSKLKGINIKILEDVGDMEQDLKNSKNKLNELIGDWEVKHNNLDKERKKINSMVDKNVKEIECIGVKVLKCKKEIEKHSLFLSKKNLALKDVENKEMLLGSQKSVLFDKEKSLKQVLDDCSAADEKLCDLNKVRDKIVDFFEDLKEFDFQMISSLENDLKNLQLSLKKYSNVDQKIIDIQSDIATQKRIVKDIEHKIDKAKNTKSGFRCSECGQEITKMALNKSIKSLKTQLLTESEKIKNFSSVLDELNNERKDRCGLESDINKTQKRIDELNVNAEKYNIEVEDKKRRLNDIDKEMDLGEAYIEKLDDRVLSIKADIKEAKNAVSVTQKEFDILKSKNSKLAVAIENAHSLLDGEKKKLNDLENMERDCQKEIRVLDKESANILAEKTKLDSDKKIFEAKIKTMEDSIKTQKSKLKKSNVAVKKETDRVSGIDVENSKLKCVSGIFGKGGLQNHVFELIIPTFQNKVNYYLSQMSEDLAVEISTKTEQKKNVVSKINFNPYVLKGGGAGYSSISSGQKRKIDVAVAMALKCMYSVIGKNLGFSFYDEILDNLDEAGIGLVIDMLKRDNGARFLISHHSNIRSEFDDTITVNMTRNVSVLEG